MSAAAARWARGALVLAGIAGLALLLYRATLAQAGFVCEACMTYQGRSSCKSASAGTRAEAERMAISTACAVVAPGVTATLACGRKAPDSLTCQAP